jgi:hypothetical protein
VLHEKLIKLMLRKDGADLHDLKGAGYKFPAVFALKLAATRGYKTSVVKKSGALARYVAKRAAGA